MEKNNNKHLVYAGLAIIIVIAIALLVPHLKSNTPAVTDTTTPTVSAPAISSTTTAAATAADNSAAWEAMLKQYQGSSIAFANDCTATPASHTFSKGQTILLVNNSNTPHKILFGSDTYQIGAFHYKTVYLGQAGVIAVDCDAHITAAQVTVQ